MTPEDVAWWAMIGQCVGAGAACVALGIVGLQVHASTKATDAVAANALSSEYHSRERLFSEAPDDLRIRRFIDLVNFLEVQAALVNSGSYPKVSREIASDLLHSCLSDIQGSAEWSAQIGTAISTSGTYRHLAIFMRRHRNTIDAVKKARHSLQERS